jgi:virginiamycin B lyase
VKRNKTFAIPVAMALVLNACFAASALAAAPVNTVLPVVSEYPDAEELTPAPVEGMDQKTNNGTWSGKPLAYSYKWQRCNASGLECKTIEGATANIYTPTAADVGNTLIAVVTAFNEEGFGSASSKPTAKVRPIGEITEYELPAEYGPTSIAPGLARQLWYTTGSDTIGKITTEGTGLTEYKLPVGSFPTDISEGSYPESFMWFANYGSGKIGKIGNTGTVTEYDVPGERFPYAITAGLEGGVNYKWFTIWSDEGEEGMIGRVNYKGEMKLFSLPGKTAGDIVVGPDGNLWFTGDQAIGKMTTAGVVTEYALAKGSYTENIAKGTEGELWFTYSGGLGHDGIGKITTAGIVTEYPRAESNLFPRGITVASDGRPWFTQVINSKIVKLEKNGTFREFGLSAESAPWDITKGADGMIWYVNGSSSEIGMITP